MLLRIGFVLILIILLVPSYLLAAEQFIFNPPDGFITQSPHDACNSHGSGFVTVGNTTPENPSFSEQYAFILEVNDHGREVRRIVYDNELLLHNGYGICQTSSGGYAIAGSKGPVPGLQTPTLTLINDQGILLAEYELSVPSLPRPGLQGWAIDVIETRDGSFVVYGETTGLDVFCMSIDPTDGSTNWYYNWGGAPIDPSYTYCNCILETHQQLGNYVLLAVTVASASPHSVICIDNDPNSLTYGSEIGAFLSPC